MQKLKVVKVFFKKKGSLGLPFLKEGWDF